MTYRGTSTYQLKKLDMITNEGRRVSLTNLYSSIQIVEDIFSNVLYGNITFIDSNDLHQLAPIIGEEIIEISYNTDGLSNPDKSLKFRVYRIESSQAEQDRIAHVLYFTSEESFNNSNTTLSKSYKNKSIPFIVRDSFSKVSSKKIDIGEFSGKYHIISPNWSPFELINYTSAIGKPKNFNGSLILFYENTNGYHYKHIEELYNQESLGEWSATTVSKENTPDVADEINPTNNIESYRIIKNSADTLKSMSEGMYSSSSISYDNITKKYKIFNYDYSKQFKDTVHLNPFKLNSNNFQLNSPQQKIVYLPSNSHRYDSKYVMNKVQGEVYPDRKEELVIWKSSLLSQMTAKQIELTVGGNISLYAGAVINIKIPNTSMLDAGTKTSHRYNTKKVLVTKIVNDFTETSHTMTLSVCDDSYTNSLEASPKLRD